jgi:hypothetical protein
MNIAPKRSSSSVLQRVNSQIERDKAVRQSERKILAESGTQHDQVIVKEMGNQTMID